MDVSPKNEMFLEMSPQHSPKFEQQMVEIEKYNQNIKNEEKV